MGSLSGIEGERMGKMDTLTATKYPLYLGEEVLGYRYVVKFKSVILSIFDLDKSIASSMDSSLVMGMSVAMKKGSKINGFMDGLLFRTENEKGVIEVRNLNEQSSMLDKISRLYKKYIEVHSNMPRYKSLFEDELDKVGLDLEAWDDRSIHYDFLMWGSEYSVDEDYDEDEVLEVPEEVKSKVNNAVKALNTIIGKDGVYAYSRFDCGRYEVNVYFRVKGD